MPQDFVDFTGEENEKEFLEKCLKQWEITTEKDIPEMIKMMQIGTVFSEIRHRIAELG